MVSNDLLPEEMTRDPCSRYPRSTTVGESPVPIVNCDINMESEDDYAHKTDTTRRAQGKEDPARAELSYSVFGRSSSATNVYESHVVLQGQRRRRRCHQVLMFLTTMNSRRQ